MPWSRCIVLAAALCALAAAETPPAPAASPAAAASAAPPAATAGAVSSPAAASPHAVPARDSGLDQSDQLAQLTQSMLQRVREEQTRLQQDIRSMTQKAIDDIRSTIAAADLTAAAAAASPAPAASPAASPAAAASPPPKSMFLEMAESLHLSMEGQRAEVGATSLEQLSEELERSLNDLTSEAGADGEAEAEVDGEADADAEGPADKKKAGAGSKKGKGAEKKAVKVKGDKKSGEKKTGKSKTAFRGGRRANGMVLRPAPDQPEGPITLRRRDDIGGHPAFSRAVAGQHSWEENLASLLSEVDESEAKRKGLRLRMVEKQNFLDSLDKRRALITADISADKNTEEVLSSHVRGINARVGRLKKERLAQELTAQRNQYAAAHTKLASEVANIQQVTDTLDSRVKAITSEVAPLVREEYSGMRGSLGVDKDAGGGGDGGHKKKDAAAPHAADAADAPKP